MNKTGFICLIIFLFFSITIDAQVTAICKVYSPGKLTSFEAGTDGAQKIMYRVMFNGQEAITWSALGFVLNGIAAGEKITIKKDKQSGHLDKFHWRLGEDDSIANNYNQIILSCISADVSFNIIARVFDGSVAFRYEIPQLKSSINSISKENTTFNFPTPYTIYQYNQESVFTPVAIDTFNNSC